jgi:hypothetical protein
MCRYEWDGYEIRRYPNGCIHRRYPWGCGVYEYWCRGQIVAVRGCASTEPDAIERHEQVCVFHGGDTTPREAQGSDRLAKLARRLADPQAQARRGISSE